MLPLELLIKTLQIKRSSYYYAKNALQKPDKYAHIRGCIHKIAEENFFTYDSPRIWLVLRTKGIRVFEKVVRRLMKEELIEVRYARRKRRYSSYIGEITPDVVTLLTIIFMQIHLIRFGLQTLLSFQ